MAHHDPPALGADAVDRRLDDDPEQRVAVQALAERLADAADRLLQPRALELELLQARLELARHRVELVAERGELVLALRRDLDREVALADVARRRQQAADLRLQRARRGERERQRADQEREQDHADEERVLRDRVVELVLGLQEVHPDRAAVESARLEAGDAVLLAFELGLAAQRQVRAPSSVLIVPARILSSSVSSTSEPGHAGHQLGVVLGGADRDAHPPGRVAAGVEQPAERGRDRDAAAGLDRLLLALERQPYPDGAAALGEILQALLQRSAVAVADRDRRAPRRSPRSARRPPSALARLDVDPFGRSLRPLEPGVRLALLGIAHDQDADERDGEHRQDHQQDEEEAEAVAEAHVHP